MIFGYVVKSNILEMYFPRYSQKDATTITVNSAYSCASVAAYASTLVAGCLFSVYK